MGRVLGFLLILIMAAAVTGCNTGGGGGGDSYSAGGSSASDESTVTLSFDFNGLLASNDNKDENIALAKIIDFITMAKACYAAGLPDFISTLYIKVTGEGMTDIIYSKNITDPAGTFSVTLVVPNGLNRIFEVKLKDKDANVLYSGDLAINVGSAGAAQDITVDVNLDESITADDYVRIGRGHLESNKLELAYAAFDMAVSLDADHPVANFFRGFTRLLLLVQKDDPDADFASPNSDITSALNLYANIDNIYLSSIAPDIYNEDYDVAADDYFGDGWNEPENITTDTGVDVIKNAFLPAVDSVISDLAKAEADVVFYTTMTSNMHFSIDHTMKVDRGDVYIFEAIAYGLKAIFNDLLAHSLRTDVDYWKDEMKKYDDDPDSYQGVEDIIESDPGAQGEKLFDFTAGADFYLSTAKSAYSTGLGKLKSGLEFFKGRSIEDKRAENHIFNLADDTDDFN